MRQITGQITGSTLTHGMQMHTECAVAIMLTAARLLSPAEVVEVLVRSSFQLLLRASS